MREFSRLSFARLLLIFSWLAFSIRLVSLHYPFTHFELEDWIWLVVPVLGLAAAGLALLKKPAWSTVGGVAAIAFLASFVFLIGEEVARTARNYPLTDALWEPIRGRLYALNYCLGKADGCFAKIFFDEVLMPLSQVLVLATVGLRPSNPLMQPTGQNQVGG